jgi:hypothetical protein
MSPINVRINDQNGLIMRGSIAVCFSAMWRIETLQTDKKRSISCQLVPLGVRAKLSGIAVCQCKNVPNQMGISWCARHAECRPYELHYVRLHVAVTPRHQVIEYGWPIIFKSEGGRIVTIANYAKESPKPRLRRYSMKI